MPASCGKAGGLKVLSPDMLPMLFAPQNGQQIERHFVLPDATA
jgi:hypothetical protein